MIFENLVLFIQHKPGTHWKLHIPKASEEELIQNYHGLYGHMGVEKVVKALTEHVFIKSVNRKVRQMVKRCKTCQMVKVNNERPEGAIITITSSRPLEKTFLDICGPFPSSGGGKDLNT